MGTRSVIFVTGNHPYGEKTMQTFRLYTQWGCPETMLRVLRDAARQAEKLLARYRILQPKAPGISAAGFAGCVLAADVGWNGLQTRIGTDVGDDGRPAEAVFHGTLDPKHYGEQGDLEWVYVLEVNARTLHIYHCGYGTPAEHLAHGPVDPRVYADELLAQYQSNCRKTIALLVRSIKSLGWQVNAAGSELQTILRHEGQRLVVKELVGHSERFVVTLNGRRVRCGHPDFERRVNVARQTGVAAPLLDWLQEHATPRHGGS
jgi:hypothetical protein